MCWDTSTSTLGVEMLDGARDGGGGVASALLDACFC
jgi:hypothetical protein